MKVKIFIAVSLLLCSILSLAADSPQVVNYRLKWQGIEKLVADETFYEEVIGFEGAVYDEDMLPVVQKTITVENGFNYDFTVENAVFVPVTQEEQPFLAASGIASDEIKIQSYNLSERGNRYREVVINPFIKKGEAYYKLSTFDLNIKKTESPAVQKVSRITQYAANSVLAGGKFVKIRIKDSGVYKLTYSDLQSMGIGNPQNVRVFGYGGGMLNENFSEPILDDLPEVAIHKSNNAIVFYAQGIHSWKYSSTDRIYRHTVNPYSNYGYYFLTSDLPGEVKTINLASKEDVPDSETIYDVTDFLDRQVHEKEERSLINSGKSYFGEIFREQRNYSFTFHFPNVVKRANSVRMFIDLAVSSSEPTKFNLSLDNADTQELHIANSSVSYMAARPGSKLSSYTPTKDDLIFNVSHIASTSASAGYLNYIEVNAYRELIMSGDAMTFQNNDKLGQNVYNRFKLRNVNPEIQVWDITDLNNVFRMPVDISGNTGEFTVGAADERRFLAIYPSASFPKPEKVADVPNQNIHAHEQVDYVIITHPDFKGEADRLAAVHRTKSNLKVGVFVTDEIYNEFSSGAPDATAYRKLMKMFYDRAQNDADRPKYLLLFGKGTFDNRGLLQGTAVNNFILTYQAENSTHETNSYVSDDYFGLLSNDESTTNLTKDLMDVGIGRFPVRTPAEAKDVVDKVISYLNNDKKGKWKNQLLLLGDDGDDNQHMSQQEEVAVLLNGLFPSYQITKIFLDAFQSEVATNGKVFPLAINKFKNLLNSGVFMVHYSGHSGTRNWTGESLLTNSDLVSMSNTRLPLWFSYSCNFNDFDRNLVSGGEDIAIKQASGGIGVYASARVVYAINSVELNKNIAKVLFKKDKNGAHYAIGDIVRMGKNETRLGTGASGINKLSYLYFGDPALKLAYPTDYRISTTKVNNRTDFENITLSALSDVSIEGTLTDDNGVKATDFNGELYITIFDKEQEITTLTSGFKYKDYPNILYSGKVKVTKGDFRADFMMPKDMKYNIGKGRIVYYAFDDTNDWEAQGYFEDFNVGGSNPSFNFNDKEGPTITSLYLNHDSFHSGDKVNESPLFVARMNDDNGINTVGAGIGHDVLLVVDNESSRTYVLNEYVDLDLGTYKSGTVKYFIPPLPEGKHTLRFRVSDLLNNTSTEILNFEVVKGLEMSIFSVRNYPNPATPETGTTFEIMHDRPETLLSAFIDIYDISGRRVYSFTQPTTDKVHWDLKSSEGFNLSNGLYIYKITVNTKDGNSVSKSNKILIQGQ
ncbi:MAG: type IX secretion system sortase PorU [Prevotellaceae bacterium]|jgi:hypothetical protein|nr:type IX secretion system sortase PorU [Prevotellaceae bacterium]